MALLLPLVVFELLARTRDRMEGLREQRFGVDVRGGLALLRGEHEVRKEAIAALVIKLHVDDSVIRRPPVGVRAENPLLGSLLVLVPKLDSEVIVGAYAHTYRVRSCAARAPR